MAYVQFYLFCVFLLFTRIFFSVKVEINWLVISHEPDVVFWIHKIIWAAHQWHLLDKK